LPVVANPAKTLERDQPEWKPLLRRIGKPTAMSKSQWSKADGIRAPRAGIISPDRGLFGIILPENALADDVPSSNFGLVGFSISLSLPSHR
jgi:hypothetical protein